MIQFHKVTLHEIPLHYAEAAGPGPALVIVHGLTGSHAEFLHLVPELVHHAHVYLLDLRGHGLSGWTQQGYQVADYARDVVAFLQQVVGRPAIVLGHSLGGLVTSWLAAHKPDLLQGAILEDSPLYLVQMPRFGKTWFYTYFTELQGYLGHYHKNGADLEEMVAHVGQTPVDADHSWLDVAGPEAVRERAIQLHQVDPATLTPTLNGTLLGESEPDALLAQIRCPVHVLAAESARGGAMDVADMTRTVAQIPHATYAIVKGAGHDIHLDQPEAFLREVKGFMATVCETIA